jgi:hypothetical protein
VIENKQITRATGRTGFSQESRAWTLSGDYVKTGRVYNGRTTPALGRGLALHGVGSGVGTRQGRTDVHVQLHVLLTIGAVQHQAVDTSLYNGAV